MSKITISVPSSVANVSCGFDVLGFCLEKPCDEMTVETKKSQGLDIEIINEKSIPTNQRAFKHSEWKRHLATATSQDSHAPRDI